MHVTNDQTYERVSDYFDDYRGTCESIRSTGAIPMLATEHVIGQFGGAYQTLIRNVAEEQGAYFANLIPTARAFDPNPTTGRDLELWGEGHPGVRTNDLIAAPMQRIVNALPRPNQVLKIFRKRSAVSVPSVDALMIDGEDHYGRAVIWEEIRTGQKALNAASLKYMDQLATGAWAVETVQSEYLKLSAGASVALGEYVLVDAILDGTAQTIESVTLLIDDPSVTVYVRDVLITPYESATRYQRFVVSGSPAVVVGATYTSNDGDLAGTFTVVGIAGDQLIMSAMDPERTKEGAGSLTRTSGTGPTSIAYSISMPGSHPDYYNNLGKAEGHWVAVTGADGEYSVTDLRGRLSLDRILFLLHKSGGMTLSEVMLRTTGAHGKPAAPVGLNAPAARGTELLAQPLCGTAPQLAAWTVVGSLTPGKIAADTNDAPAGISGYVTVSAANTMAQAFTLVSSSLEDQEVEVRIWARRWPVKVNSATFPTGAEITADSCDWRRVKVDLIDGQMVAPFRAAVGLWWREVVLRTIIAPGVAYTIKVSGDDGDIQIGKVSCKPVDA